MDKQHKSSNNLVFSLKQFQSNSGNLRTSASKNPRENDGEDEQKSHERNKIYSSYSFKQDMDQQLTQTSVEAHNKVFEMVFSKGSTRSPSTPESRKHQSQNNHLRLTDFVIGRKIGKGKFGEVFIARHIISGFVCAIKKIEKGNIDQKILIQLIREIKIQSFLNHPNVVKMYTFFCDSTAIYLVLELCYSGQLFNFLRKKKRLNEDFTKTIVNQICKALDYMHENEIIHRDLKPQNIIFHSGMIKICDFGWSISSQTMRQTFCGTPLYVSPELLKRKDYNNKIDVWSIGILTYELLLGRVPFDIVSEKDFIKIVEDEIKFSKGTPISCEAKDFIHICLKKDPRDRYTVPELLDHPFLAKLEPVQITEMY